MSRFRHRGKWIAAAVVAAAGFFIPFRIEADAQFFICLLDAAHLPAFFALTWFAAVYWPLDSTPCRRRLLAASLAATLCVAVEALQPLTGRTHSLTDLANGFAGIALVMAFMAAAKSPRRARWLSILVPLAASCAALALLPAWRESAGMRWRRANFPLLADFENDAQMRLWIGTGLGNMRNDGAELERSATNVAEGQFSLRVETKPEAKWPGVRLLAGGQDWSRGTALAFDVFNDGPPFTLSLRIDDDFPHRHHDDRYNGAFSLQPGWNRVRIPLAEIAAQPRNRRLNTAAVRLVIWFVNEPATVHRFFLDHVRVE